MEEGGGGVTPIRGLVYMCLPVSWVMFCEFCTGYGHGSALWRFAAIMDTFLAIYSTLPKTSAKKNFASKVVQNSLFVVCGKFCPVFGVICQNFALFLGSYVKILPCFWGHMSKFCPGMGTYFCEDSNHPPGLRINPIVKIFCITELIGTRMDERVDFTGMYV